MDALITLSELDMARFLEAMTFERKQTPWRFHTLHIPSDELSKREYEYETERLRRFVRGQHITNPNQGAAA